MKKIALALGALMFVSACATAKVWQATGGSRADGTVRLSYQFGAFEAPELVDDGTALAVERCKVWGYTGATAFGGVTSQCQQISTSGCMSTLVTKEFQCTGQGNGGHAEILVRSSARGSH